MLERELRLAEQLARQAGELVRAQQTEATVSYKPDGQGPVTSADLAADQLICQSLIDNFGKDIIITEESFELLSEAPAGHRVWFIDPIDGTKDYVSGGIDYSVMIGLCIDGQPAVGAVYQPATDVLWSGINTPQCKKAKRTDSRGTQILDLTKRVMPKEGPVVAISRSHPSKFEEFLFDELGVSKVIRKGSVGLKVALILDGHADFYLAGTRRIKMWDTCAAHAIICGADGVIKTIEGKPLRYQGPVSHGVAIYASTAACEEWIKSRIAKVIK